MTAAMTPTAEGFRTRVAMDADDHAANLTGWNQLYDQLTPGRFCGSVNELWLDGLQVFCEITSHTVRQSCEVWPDSWWFGIPINEDTAVKIGHASIEKDAIAVRPGGTEFELLTPNRFHILGAVVRQQELANYIQATECIDAPPVFLREELLHIGEEKKLELQKLLQQMLSEVAATPQLLHHQASRQGIRDSLLHALVGVSYTQLSTEKMSATVANRYALVRQVREYLLVHRDTPVTIPDICRSFFVSRRTLQNAFHHVVGMSPAAYLRALRLNGVRRMLRDKGSDIASVQDAACEWGFWHLSQFACDYRRMFGELPSNSLRQRSSQR
ncbi:MAG: helix-turn-helix domain-containing protein [Acidobacteriaceae bacterium]